MIKSLHIKNFRSFPNNETVIDFTEGINFVTGSNGSGKSTIKNALLFCLYGKCAYKKSDITNVATNGECYTKAVLDVNCGTELVIERTMKNLEIRYAGEKLSFPSIVSANAFIVKTIKMRYNIAAFLMAFSGDSCITGMTPAKRKEIVEVIMGLDIIKAVNDKAKAYINNAKNSVDSIKAIITSYQNNVESIRSILESDCIDNTKEIQRINERLDALKDEYEKNITKSQESSVTVNKYRSSLMTLSNNASVLKSKKDDLVYRANAIQSMNVCPTCRQSVTDAIKNKIISDYKKEYDKVSEEWDKSKSEYDEADKQLADATAAYNEINSNLLKINTEVSELRASLSTMKKTSDIISKSDDTIAKLEQNITDKKNELEETQRKLDIMSKIYEKTKKDADCILQVISTHLELISKHASNIIGTKITFNPDYTITATDRDMDISVMSTGEQNKIDFAIKIALLDTFMTTTSEVDTCFIDESLANVDIDAICDIVKLLRKYTHHRHVNMYLMHHAPIDETIFDSVMHISKATGFSMIDINHNYIA